MGLANKITIIRIMLVPFLAACFIYYDQSLDILRYAALGIFIVCGITDAVDGYVARSFYQKTKLGKMLDPLADKILIITSYIALSVMGNIPLASRIPPWLSIIVISRDALLLLGAGVIFVMTKDIEIRPSFLGKATTFFQMATVVLALLQTAWISPILWITAALTVSSGFAYVWRGTRTLSDIH